MQNNKQNCNTDMKEQQIQIN